MTDCQCDLPDYAGIDWVAAACWNCGRAMRVRPDTPILDEILIHPERFFFDAVRWRGFRQGPSEYHRTLKPTHMDFSAPDTKQSFYFDYA